MSVDYSRLTINFILTLIKSEGNLKELQEDIEKDSK